MRVLFIVLPVILVLLWVIIRSSVGLPGNVQSVASHQEDRHEPTIGMLGGVPVSIPKPYANFVEYDGDREWMETNKGASPTRTFASKLSSFGFELRFPHMEVMSDTTTLHASKEDVYSTMRMRVGVNSNSAYGSAGDTALEAYISSIPSQQGHPYRFEKLPEAHYGLTGYTSVGVDVTRRNVIGMADMNDKNIYFHRDQKGKADAYIECSNMLHAAARCELRFNMLPEMHGLVSVNFRKELLPHWREIQSSVHTVILGFRVNPAITSIPHNKAAK